MPYDKALRKTYISPRKVSELKEIVLPNASKKTAPQAPSRMPIIFFEVTFSLINTAAAIKTKMGVAVMMMEALMGVVRARPLKNNTWLMATPLSPQQMRRKMSLRSAFSLLKKGAKAKNKRVVTKTRSKINPVGKI